MIYSVYAIYNRKHDKIYIGQTDNIEKRLKLHNDKIFKGSYTARFDGEWELIHQEQFLTRQDALLRERKLKNYRGRQFIRSIVNTKYL